MGQAATLKKISLQLNLSISTVSRALSNHPDISEQTKRKVKELAALMDYEPNNYAVNLRRNKSRVFGLVVSAISNFFYDSFIAAVEEEARKHGYTLMILQSGDDPVLEAENLKLCRHNRVDGIFVSLAPDSISADLFARFRESSIPLIFFDKVNDSGLYDTVCMADEEAALTAAHTIINYKKKNVLALFGNPTLSITKKRKETFLELLSSTQPAIHAEIRHCLNSEQARQAVTDALAGKHAFDNVFCMSDELLIGAMKAIHHSALSVPGDISVLAISNGFIPGLFKPEITHIETNGYELGKLAIKRMLENMESKSAPKSIILPTRLISGGSM